MNARYFIRPLVLALVLSLGGAAAFAQGTQAPNTTFEPQVGQPGKDVVWVPTPQELVDLMLNMAKVTPQDVLYDLGSGDGRTVITAAKRGTRAFGIEYNQDMVDLAKRNATTAKVDNLATFRKADLFETDFSDATVVTMFLLPSINMKLRPTILDMKPGTRVVSNSFHMEEWMPDDTQRVDGCTSWCTALFWIVPAKVAGTWRMPQGPMNVTQDFQVISGRLGAAPITGKLRGADISFNIGTTIYNGRVDGNVMKGTTSTGQPWQAEKVVQ